MKRKLNITNINNEIKIKDILSYYNVIGLSISVAIGLAGKDLIFSLSDDIIIPCISILFSKITGRETFIKSKNKTKIQFSNFFSSLLTFFFVTMLVIFILYSAFRPIVKDDVLHQRENDSALYSIQDNIEIIAQSYENNNNLLEKIEQNTKQNIGNW